MVSRAPCAGAPQPIDCFSKPWRRAAAEVVVSATVPGRGGGARRGAIESFTPFCRGECVLNPFRAAKDVFPAIWEDTDELQETVGNTGNQVDDDAVFLSKLTTRPIETEFLARCELGAFRLS